MKLVTAALAALVLISTSAREARAQLVEISVSPSSFSFPSGDPDTTPVVTGPQLIISYKVAGPPKQGWHITIRGTDLTSGSDTIPATNVTWVASPAPPFTASGTLTTTDQTLAGEAYGHAAGTQTGYITFSLKNLWTYNAGTYTQTITFTISSP